MANNNCVLCHPEKMGNGTQWVILCPTCMDRLMRECKNLAKMEEWVRAEHAAALRAAKGEGDAH